MSVGLGAALGSQFVEDTVLRPEVETRGLSVCVFGDACRGSSQGLWFRKFKSGWVAQCQTVGWPHEQGPLVSLCEASLGIQVGWGQGSLWDPSGARL